MTGGFEALHATLAETRRLVAILRAVVEVAVLPRLDTG
jgi:hypothetical protein